MQQWHVHRGLTPVLIEKRAGGRRFSEPVFKEPGLPSVRKHEYVALLEVVHRTHEKLWTDRCSPIRMGNTDCGLAPKAAE